LKKVIFEKSGARSAVIFMLSGVEGINIDSTHVKEEHGDSRVHF
jgi:hypothetical protein